MINNPAVRRIVNNDAGLMKCAGSMGRIGLIVLCARRLRVKIEKLCLCSSRSSKLPASCHLHSRSNGDHAEMVKKTKLHSTNNYK